MPKQSSTPGSEYMKLVVMDIQFDCPVCRKKVKARLTAYPDVSYVTCAPGRHHHNYPRPRDIPGFDNFIDVRIGDEADEEKR